MHRRAHFEWKLRSRSLALGTATRVMGVLNVTPDSFSDGGRLHSVEEAIETALGMFADGAAIVDIGGESTRPGVSGTISMQQEIDRVLPVIEGIRRAQPGALLSIDTYHAALHRRRSRRARRSSTMSAAFCGTTPWPPPVRISNAASS